MAQDSHLASPVEIEKQLVGVAPESFHFISVLKWSHMRVTSEREKSGRGQTSAALRACN
jgi:hypothetical protein